MQILRHAMIVFATISVAASAHAQSEAEEFFAATDAGPVLEAYEHGGDEIVDDNATAAEWPDADLPGLDDDSFANEATLGASYWFGGAELTRFEPRYSLATPAFGNRATQASTRTILPMRPARFWVGKAPAA